MRIIIATPYLPWPLYSGGNAAQFSTIKALAEEHAFVLVCPIRSKAQQQACTALAASIPQVRVRGVWCARDRSGLARTIANDIRALLRWTARSIRRFGFRKESNPHSFIGKPYDPFTSLPSEYINALSEEIEIGADVVQVEFAEMLSLGPWLPRSIPKVFIHHQIQYVFIARLMATSANSAFGAYTSAYTLLREVACLQHFDAVVTFSEDDRACLAHEVEPRNIYISPFPVPSDVGFATQPATDFSGTFCFLGAEEHYPNQDGLVWLLSSIWPTIVASLPKAKLRVIGKWSREWSRRGASAPGQVEFVGFVEDIASTLQGSILLVPLRIGSGIRTKMLAALARGVPCVATSVAAEGIHRDALTGILIADTEAHFATAAVKLASDTSEWRSLAEKGLAAVSKHYSPAAIKKARNLVYTEVVTRHANRKSSQSD